MPRKKKRSVSSLNPSSKVKVGVSLTSASAKRLNDAAQQLGISRSEFVERMAQGEFTISHDGTPQTTVLETDQDSDNPTVEIDSTENQETATSSTSPESVNTVDQTEEQLKLYTEKIQTLETQLKQSIPEEKYNDLQQELQQHQQTIENLQQQVQQVSSLETQLKQSIPEEKYNNLQQELQQYKSTTESLRQQLHQRVSQEAYNQLQRQTEQQNQTIEQLQNQVIKLNALASIGQAQTRKWQNRSF